MKENCMPCAQNYPDGIKVTRHQQTKAAVSHSNAQMHHPIKNVNYPEKLGQQLCKMFPVHIVKILHKFVFLH
jgi:hypothetical protein